jgi:hypothetical protein
MTLPDGKWWWAYLDDGGVIRIQKYISDWEIQKVEQLPFCRGIFDPFPARSKNEAKLILKEWLDEQQANEKKIIE